MSVTHRSLGRRHPGEQRADGPREGAGLSPRGERGHTSRAPPAGARHVPHVRGRAARAARAKPCGPRGPVGARRRRESGHRRGRKAPGHRARGQTSKVLCSPQVPKAESLQMQRVDITGSRSLPLFWHGGNFPQTASDRDASAQAASPGHRQRMDAETGETHEPFWIWHGAHCFVAGQRAHGRAGGRGGRAGRTRWVRVRVRRRGGTPRITHRACEAKRTSRSRFGTVPIVGLQASARGGARGGQ